MSLQTENRIYGLSKNPWNPNFSIGGSSGGEGGLVPSKCVPLGIGTDIGGSIRAPSLFGGAYGFKPTSARSSMKGTVMPYPGDHLV
jgi:Asp-tRNA(Asn)/Glu-tRNA(Gln) amidotransferase A subunit family amidase